MMSKTGTVIKLKETSAIIMTENSDFLLIKKRPGLFVGQPICFDSADLLNPRMELYKYFSMLAAVVAAAVMLFFSYSRFYLPGQAYAYIALDINPSLEFAVDTENRVRDLILLDDGAKALVQGLSLKKLPLEQAFGQVIAKAGQRDLISPEKENIILVSAALNSGSSLYTRNRETAAEKLDSLLDICQEAVASGQPGNSIRVGVIKVSSQERQLARENDTSMGRYHIYTQAREQGIDLTLDEARKAPLKQLIDRVPPETGSSLLRPVPAGPPPEQEEVLPEIKPEPGTIDVPSTPVRPLAQPIPQPQPAPQPQSQPQPRPEPQPYPQPQPQPIKPKLVLEVWGEEQGITSAAGREEQVSYVIFRASLSPAVQDSIERHSITVKFYNGRPEASAFPGNYLGEAVINDQGLALLRVPQSPGTYSGWVQAAETPWGPLSSNIVLYEAVKPVLPPAPIKAELFLEAFTEKTPSISPAALNTDSAEKTSGENTVIEPAANTSSETTRGGTSQSYNYTVTFKAKIVLDGSLSDPSTLQGLTVVFYTVPEDQSAFSERPVGKTSFNSQGEAQIRFTQEPGKYRGDAVCGATPWGVLKSNEVRYTVQ